jgi:hypothetical protein
MRGDGGAQQLGVEQFGAFGLDQQPRRHEAVCIGAPCGAVMGETLDAKRLGALAHPKMNHHMRLQLIVEARHGLGGLPGGGQHADVEFGIDLKRRTLRERFGKPSRGIIGDTRKRAKAREKDARPCHAPDLP